MTTNFTRLSLWCVAIAAVCSLLPTSALADDSIKVAYVDIQRALESTDKGQSVQKKFKDQVQDEQKQIDKKKAEFERLKKSLESQQGSLNEEALMEKQESLLKSEKELKRAFQDSQEKLKRQNATLVGELVKDMRVLVGDVAKDKGLNLVLERRSQGILFADDSLDITEDVVKRFNAEHGE